MRNRLELPGKLALMMLVAALCLGATEVITEEPILRQSQIQAEALRKEALPQASSFLELKVPEAPESLVTAFEAPEGYVFEMNSSGFGGALAVTVGITKDGSIAGVRVGSHSETPGLGAKATEEKFYSQYSGMTAQTVQVTKSTPGEGEIQAITAATITSHSVTDAVNAAITCYDAVRGEAK